MTDRFAATSITQVTFVDDPAFTPGAGRKEPTVDTVLFTGTGKWNGAAGYTFEVRAADRGESGRNRDTLYVVIKNLAPRDSVLCGCGNRDQTGGRSE